MLVASEARRTALVPELKLSVSRDQTIGLAPEFEEITGVGLGKPTVVGPLVEAVVGNFPADIENVLSTSFLPQMYMVLLKKAGMPQMPAAMGKFELLGLTGISCAMLSELLLKPPMLSRSTM